MPPDNNSDPFFSGPPFGAALFDSSRFPKPEHKSGKHQRAFVAKGDPGY